MRSPWPRSSCRWRPSWAPPASSRRTTTRRSYVTPKPNVTQAGTLHPAARPAGGRVSSEWSSAGDDFARTRLEQAIASRDRRHVPAALELSLEAIAAIEADEGRESPSLVSALIVLASVPQAGSSLEEAERTALRAVAITEGLPIVP